LCCNKNSKFIINEILGVIKMLEKKIMLLGIILILSVVPFSGCTNTNQTSNTKLGPNEVAIQNMAFNPPSLTVKAGTSVKWTNLDPNTHDVTSDTGIFQSGNLSNGQSYSYTFNQTGTYPYHCAIHPFMKASIVVQ
jgi:amicyanin